MLWNLTGSNEKYNLNTTMSLRQHIEGPQSTVVILVNFPKSKRHLYFFTTSVF